MKKNFEILLVMTAFFSCLLMPSVVVSGAADGVRLVLFTVIPTFFPFLFLSDYMETHGISKRLGNLLSPLFCRLFSCSSAGAYCIFMGFLCGYPMGAKTVGDAYTDERLTRREACYLLSFCNNASPMFLSGYVLTACFPDHALSLANILLLFYLPPVLVSFLCRLLFLIPPKKFAQNKIYYEEKKERGTKNLSSASADKIIVRSFYTLLKLSGYIILFSILAALSHTVFRQSPLLSGLLPCFLEITSGLSVLAAASFPFSFSFPLACAFTLFGGLSCLFQTASVLEGSDLPITPYLFGKITQFFLGLLLSYALFHFI